MAVNLGVKEKRLIIWGVIVLAITVIAPNLLSKEAFNYRNKQVSAKLTLDKKVNVLRTNLDGIEDRKSILRRYINRYKLLVEEETILPPDTVALVKHMKAINEQRKQEATSFEFGSNVKIGFKDSVYTLDSTVDINVLPLNIKMGMLHDMDMFMFLESLEERVSNVAFPVKCSLTLINESFSVSKRDNMSGECQVNWYSVTDPMRNLKSIGEEDGGAQDETAETAAVTN
ncbi:MAG: hypothetical protein ACNYPH_02115 [Gammaproteobacteria bacterium WSBS_2016_MAG_OTU1]